ncbi:MAG: BREX-6 system adenine-specific DNA-methyltransferase PglX [Myxococcales bacterium]|nr:BREX-6 system adenine-specific DNA-methyltransferase PglX [Myxococcales bacterium]
MTRSAPMSPDTKSRLASAIKRLRARLLTDLATAAEGSYRLSVPAEDAGLTEALAVSRRRLESWLSEQARGASTGSKADAAGTRARFFALAVREAAYTFTHRLVIVRVLEALGLSKPTVLTGGFGSTGYRGFREFAPELCTGEAEGYDTLLGLLFGELAATLPGVFGDVGLTSLFPVPAATMRAAVEDLNDPELDGAWLDDTTLGWVYQYWNDPDRDALDEKIKDGGKIEPHEIASKTQMFTERYMVEWILENTLGTLWLAMCRKHRWTAEVEATGVLGDLERRRAEWRALRDAGEKKLDELMPIADGLEARWKYWVKQPILADAIEHAPSSLRELKLLDPACGSGHFLVIAFDLLLELYREEARHRKTSWSDREIAEWIIEDNLHGLDIDPRAVQIAAAALQLKVREVAPTASPKRVNLVASALRLGNLASDDPALQELRREIFDATGMPGSLTDHIITALKGADHLGSLLKVDRALDEAIVAHQLGHTTVAPRQLRLGEVVDDDVRARKSPADRGSLESAIDAFLARHTGGDDLGLRLRGEQLAAGIRFVRMIREGTYHLVVGNPPYQGTGKMADAKYIETRYPRGKADLYAAFLERGLQLARPGGVSALLTMRNWMFIKQFSPIRKHLLGDFDLRLIGDFDRGAFADIPDEVVSVSVCAFRRVEPSAERSLATLPTPREDNARDSARTSRKHAALLAGVGRHEFAPKDLQVVPEWPLVYWWDQVRFDAYRSAPLIGAVSPARQGLATADNARFIRKPWEVVSGGWAPYIKGAAGRAWLEACCDVVFWRDAGLQVQTYEVNGRQASRPQNQSKYFQRGVAFSMIGASFTARVHRLASIFGHKGSSVFPENLAYAVCAMNSNRAREILQSLNPGIGFEVGDVNRLPLFPIAQADEIFARIESAFTEHEQARETSVEFVNPGPSPWRYAQAWAQEAVDRPEGAPLPPYEPVYDPPTPTAWVSYALGQALGRFPSSVEPLPDGILWLTKSGSRDSLDHDACARLREAFAEHGAAIAPGKDVRTWLRTDFFAVHERQYENRPIWWPLSSEKRSFVAWVAIHRMSESTLTTVIARYLKPERVALEGRLADIQAMRASGDKRAAREAEDQLAIVKPLMDELEAFIAAVTDCAERGPPDEGGPKEVSARYAPVLDDGVMVNSAALWPLLKPQWKKPETWWKELRRPKGRKDYDWSHLAARYFPARVDAKCRVDPSLAVAHGCFWRYHPARAYAWELRLQDEIGPDFRLEEQDADAHRAAFLKDHAQEAADLFDHEMRRREKKNQKTGPSAEGDELDFDGPGADDDEGHDD